MEPKPFYQSNTLAGGVMMLVALGLQLTQAPPVPQEDLAQATVQLGQVIQGIAGLVGFALVVWGRFKARRPLSLSGK